MLEQLKKHSSFITILFLITVTNALQSVIGNFLTPYLISLSINATWIGVLHATLRVGSLVMILPSGILSDKIQVRPLFIIGIVLSSLFFGGLLVSTSPWILLLLFLIGGIGTTILLTVATTVFYKNIGEHKDTKGTVLEIGKNFVGALFTLVSGYAILLLSYQSIFFSALFVVLFFFLLFSFIPKHTTYQVQTEEYFKELKRKEVSFLLLFYGLYIFHAGGDSVSIPAIWKQELGFSTVQIGLLASIPILILGTIGAWGLLQFSKNKPSLSKKFAFWGCLLSGLGHLLISFGSTFDQAMIGRFVHITGDTVMGLFLTIELAYLFSKKSIGGNFGLANLLITIIATVSTIIAGVFGNYLSHHTFLYLSAGISIVGALWSLWWKVDFRREKEVVLDA